MARGDLAPGDQIPSQRDLAQQLRVNPNTVQRAYREMEYLGLVETRRGTGTFISPDPARWEKVREEAIQAELSRFIATMVQLGCTGEQIVDLVRSAVDSPATRGRRGEPAAPVPCPQERSRNRSWNFRTSTSATRASRLCRGVFSTVPRGVIVGPIKIASGPVVGLLLLVAALFAAGLWLLEREVEL